jgi:hypothetical protein
MPPEHTARFTTRFTTDQREALMRAAFIDQIEPRTRIWKLAGEGRLKDASGQPVPAFKVGDYGYQILRNGREEFEARFPEALDLAEDEELRANSHAAVLHSRRVRERMKLDGTDDPDALARDARHNPHSGRGRTGYGARCLTAAKLANGGPRDG